MSTITVYYDGACPTCRRERDFYRRLTSNHAIEWFDITGQDQRLRAEGIDPQQALLNLHVRLADGTLVTGIDAFIALWRQAPLLRPLAWLAARQPIRPRLARWYDALTLRRLQRSGRGPAACPRGHGKHRR